MDFKLIQETQYQMLASRRQNHDTMLWQTPVISLTAQAFLFTVALGSGGPFERILASVLALVSAIASVHLLARQRFLELYYSQVLEAIERAKEMQVIHTAPPKATGFFGWSAYRVWHIVFWTFGLVSVLVALHALGEISSTKNDGGTTQQKTQRK